VTGDNLVTGDPGPSAGVMSSNSDTGSGDRVQATLDVIMRCLDIIELKLEPLQPLPTHWRRRRPTKINTTRSYVMQ
jgi:hypothetical protein